MNYLQQLNKARKNIKLKELKKTKRASFMFRLESFLEEKCLSRTASNVVKAKEHKANSKEYLTELEDLLKDL